MSIGARRAGSTAAASIRRFGLVGRDAETDVLVQRLDELVTAGIGSTVLISGPAGIGKSALIEATAAAARAADVLPCVGGSALMERDRPFGAVLAAAAAGGGALAAGCTAIREQLLGGSTAAIWEREGSIGRFAIHDRLVEMIDEAVAAEPLLLAIDDLHWADPASIATIGAYSAIASRSPLLLVLGYRTIPRPEPLVDLLRSLGPSATELRLSPLSLDQSAALVEARLGGASLPFPVARLGGNPFLLVSAAAAAPVEQRQLPLTTIKWAILGRLDGLSERTVELLRTGAAFGRPFEAAELAIVHSVTPLAIISDLDEAVRAGVLVSVGEHLDFVHDLVGETMLAELSEPLRRGLHRMIWQAMARADRPPSAYAAHVLMACAPGDREAIACLRRAGEELAEPDPQRAATLLAKAADLAEPLGWAERGEIVAERAELLRLACRPAEVVELVEGCASWPIPAVQLARLEYIGASALRFLGRVPEATAMLRRAISREALSPEMASWAWSLIAGSEVFSMVTDGDLSAATAEARRLADDAGDRAALVQSWCASSYVLWIKGRIDDALVAAERAVELGAALGNVTWPAPALAHAVALLGATEPAAAIAAITPWGRRAEQAGDLWALSRMEMVTVMASFTMGAWDSIDGHCDTIARVGIETGGANGQPLAQAMAGLIAVRRGDLDLARAKSSEGHRILESPCVDPLGLPFLGALDAELAEADGDIVGGRAIYDATYDFGAAVSPVVNFWLGLPVALRAIEAGDTSRFETVCSGFAAASAGSTGAPWRRLGEAMGRHDAPAAELAAADPIVCRLPFHRREALLIAAALYRSVGDAPGVARCVGHARGIERSLGIDEVSGGDGSGANTAHTAASRGGERRPTFGPDSLSPAEAAVLDLVCLGMTNAAIAARLFLSKRTVESHMSRMYVKLGAATRVELARVGMSRLPRPSAASF